ncbi:MAG: non-canonical purine NTP pyrophosphatase [bacterium]|nr:non-canonical purine NTP pyrophosphatase [bacterium]
MEIVLSTRNQSKAQQIKALFDGLSISVLTLNEAGITGEALEDGATLEENALKKALFATQRSRKWSIADDTGVFIDALGEQPGIHAGRWAGERASTEDIMRHTLKMLAHVSSANRTGTFKTVAAIVAPDGMHFLFTGEVRGSFLNEPRTLCQPKMPYSAIFVPEGQTKVWAEMTVDEENAISHRGKAFAQVRDFFQDFR